MYLQLVALKLVDMLEMVVVVVEILAVVVAEEEVDKLFAVVVAGNNIRDDLGDSIPV